jgi:hypothetical protein
MDLLLATMTDKWQTRPLVREGASRGQEETSDHEPQPLLDTKTDRQSQCDFDFDLTKSLAIRNKLQGNCPVSVATPLQCLRFIINHTRQRTYPRKLNTFYIKNRHKLWSRDISVGIASGYGLDDRGSISGTASDFSPLHRVQNGSGAHPAAYPMGTRGSCPGGRVATW